MHCLVAKGFITNEESVVLKEEILKKPISRILKDFRSQNSLSNFIWIKRNKEYNFNYFKTIPSRYNQRKPFWLTRGLSKEDIESIRSEQLDLVECLRETKLISTLTYVKIKRKINFGIFYKIWEILEVASNLTRNEEFYDSLDLRSELEELVNCEFIKEEQVFDIENDIIEGRVNQTIDIIEKYSLGYSVYFENSTQDPEREIRYVLNYFLPKLPFYESLEVNDVSFYSEGLPWPFDRTCVVRIMFNKRKFVFPINANGSSLRMAPGFNFYLIPKIIHHLYKVYNYAFPPIILINTFLDCYSYQRNYESFTMLFMSNIPGLPIKKDWFIHGLRNDYPHTPIVDKVNYLAKVFELLDADRLNQSTKKLIQQMVINCDIRGESLIPTFIENFTVIIWNDDFGPSCSYIRILEKFKRISNNHFDNAIIKEKIVDEMTVVTIKIGERTFSRKLVSTQLDYDFCELISRVQKNVDLNGKFYGYGHEGIEDGFAFVFLSNSEFKRQQHNNVLIIFEIDKIRNIWLKK